MKKTRQIINIFLSLCMIVSCMAGLSITAGAEDIGSGFELSSLFENGGNGRLTSEITIMDYMYVDNGVTVTLDLNGHTLTLFGSGVNFAIRNEGTLTITDNSSGKNGKITRDGATAATCIDNAGVLTLSGGNICGYSSVGVINRGTNTFNMTGGTISGNTATTNGGGVYNLGTFNMTGGTISGNTTAANGGGVYNQGTFTMTGGTISDNTATVNGGGVYNQGTFTMTGGTISDSFYDSNNNYVTVTFNANSGTGTTSPQYVRKSTATALKANGFTAPADKTFGGWNTKADGTGTSYADKANITLTADTTLYAQWTSGTYDVTYVYDDQSTKYENIAAGSKHTLKSFRDFSLTDPDDGFLLGWEVGEEVYDVGAEITITGDTTITLVTGKKPLNNDKFGMTVNGKAQVTVTPVNGNTALTEGTDYTVKFYYNDNEVAKSALVAGTEYFAVASGAGRYEEESSVSAEFTYNPITDISKGTVTVDTSAKSVTVTADGETVPSSDYHVIYFTYEETEDGEHLLTRVGTEFPTEPGTYIAAVIVNEGNTTYKGENRSDPFTVSSSESGGSGGNGGSSEAQPVFYSYTYTPSTTPLTQEGTKTETEDDTKDDTKEPPTPAEKPENKLEYKYEDEDQLKDRLELLKDISDKSNYKLKNHNIKNGVETIKWKKTSASYSVGIFIEIDGKSVYLASVNGKNGKAKVIHGDDGRYYVSENESSSKYGAYVYDEASGSFVKQAIVDKETAKSHADKKGKKSSIVLKKLNKNEVKNLNQTAPRLTETTAKAKKKKTTVTIENIEGATKYRVRYSTYPNMYNAKTKTVKSDSDDEITVTLMKLKKSKRYYCSVEALIDGEWVVVGYNTFKAK